MSDKHSTPKAPKANEFKLTDSEKMDLRDGLQAWAGLLRSRSAQDRLTARLLETTEQPDVGEAQECLARGYRDEKSADRLDQLAAKVNASIGLDDQELLA